MMDLGIHIVSRLYSLVAKSNKFGFYSNNNEKSSEDFKLGSFLIQC